MSTQSRWRDGWLPRLPVRGNELGLLAALAIVLVLTVFFDHQKSYLADPGGSLQDVLRQAGMLGIFALGSAIVIIAGGIDLSCGSMIAFGGTICASIMVVLAPEAMRNAEPLPVWVIGTAIVGTLFVGFVIGSTHAAMITWLRMPPFVATLGSLVGLRSAARVLTEHVTRLITQADRGTTQIDVFDARFRGITTWTARVPMGDWWSATWQRVCGGVAPQASWVEISVPISSIAFLILAICAAVLMSRTVLGRHLYALGGNEEAARLSGIRTGHLKWFVYSLSAMLASLAGIMYIGDQGVAAPEQLARGYELNAIAAAVVGGCALQGGLGTMAGTVLGVIFLRTVIDAVSKIIDVGADLYEGMIVGVVVVLAVSINRLRRV